LWLSLECTDGLDRLGCFLHNRNRRGLAFGLLDVDAALEESAILDADARGRDIAGQSALGANVHAIRGRDIAAHLAQDHNLAGGDAGGDLAVSAYGYAVTGQIDAALDLAVDKQRLGAGDLALDDQTLPDGGLIAGAGSNEAAGGAGRVGSGVMLGVIDPDWLGFHIALKGISFSVLWGPGYLGRGRCRKP